MAVSLICLIYLNQMHPTFQRALKIRDWIKLWQRQVGGGGSRQRGYILPSSVLFHNGLRE